MGWKGYDVSLPGVLWAKRQTDSGWYIKKGSTVPRTVPLAWRKRGRGFSSGRIRDVDTRDTQSLRRSLVGDMVAAHNSQVFIWRRVIGFAPLDKRGKSLLCFISAFLVARCLVQVRAHHPACPHEDEKLTFTVCAVVADAVRKYRQEGSNCEAVAFSSGATVAKPVMKFMDHVNNF